MNQLSMKVKLIILAICAAALLGIFGLGYITTRFQVTSTDPGQNKKINTYNVLILNFNRPVTADSTEVSSEPAAAFTTSVDGKKLVVRPSAPLKNLTKYTVKITGLCDAKKPTACISYTLKFSTDNSIPLISQSDAQQAQVVAPVDAEYKDVPVLSILPVNETDYLIEAKPAGNFTYIVITPNLDPQYLTDQQYNDAYAKYYAEGVAYITNKGFQLSGSKFKVVSSQEFSNLSAGGD
jgi:hypothetical protein